MGDEGDGQNLGKEKEDVFTRRAEELWWGRQTNAGDKEEEYFGH